MGLQEQLSYAFGVLGAQAAAARRERGPGAALGVLTKALPMIGSELLGTVSMVPYGVRAARARRRAAREGRLLERRYGPKEKNVMDVYLPPGHVMGATATGDALARRRGDGGPPIVLFVPGGIWVNCDAWQYSVLASRLAGEGSIAAVMEYTTYPTALADEMSREVGAALDWLQRHSASLGASPDRVMLMAHSAGCQLAATEILRRALLHAQAPGRADARAQAPLEQRADADRGGSVIDAETGGGALPRQPTLFVGMSGVYDIHAHFEHELSRGVAHVSTMKPACGGHEGFDDASPAIRMRKLAEEDSAPAVALREALCLALPRTVLLSSTADVVVPPTASERLADAYQCVGAAPKLTHLAYDGICHGDFAVGWDAGAPQCGGAAALAEEPLLVDARRTRLARARRDALCGGVQTARAAAHEESAKAADADKTLAPVEDVLAIVLGSTPVSAVPPGRINARSANASTEPATARASTASGRTSPAAAMVRVEGAECQLPIAFGTVAFYMGKKATENNSHKWTVYLRGAGGEDVDLSHVVSKVVFGLHPSFKQPQRGAGAARKRACVGDPVARHTKRMIESPPYEVTEMGWGEFEITITVHFHADANEKPLELTHALKLYEDGFQQGAAQSTKKPVVSEKYDEVVFLHPEETFHSRMENHVPVPLANPSSLSAHFPEHVDRDELVLIDDARRKIAEQKAELEQQIEAVDAEVRKIKGVV
eukprot:PRCOL_00005988-RA